VPSTIIEPGRPCRASFRPSGGPQPSPAASPSAQLALPPRTDRYPAVVSISPGVLGQGHHGPEPTGDETASSSETTRLIPFRPKQKRHQEGFASSSSVPLPQIKLEARLRSWTAFAGGHRGPMGGARSGDFWQQHADRSGLPVHGPTRTGIGASGIPRPRIQTSRSPRCYGVCGNRSGYWSNLVNSPSAALPTALAYAGRWERFAAWARFTSTWPLQALPRSAKTGAGSPEIVTVENNKATFSSGRNPLRDL